MGFRTGTILAALAIALACASTVAAKSAAAPANDNFANAQGVSGASGTATGSNTGATKEAGEPNHAGNAGGASIWYRWTAPATGTATVDTIGSSFDTLLGVYTGSSVSSLTTVTSNDDCCGGTQSKASFPAVNGTTYQIAVDGYKKAMGSVTLHWSLSSPPANDMFASAQGIAGQSGTTTGSNVGATKEAGEPNHAGNAGGTSIWYRWTAPATGTATVDTIGSSFDTLLGVYTGSSVGSLTTIASNDDCCSGSQSKVSFPAVSGTTYQIAVDGYNKATGSVTLDWSIVAGPANDMFAGALPLAGASGTAGGTNTNATKEPGEPNHAGNAGGASVWYRWTATAATPVSIDTSGSGFDTLLAVYTGSSVNALTPVASNDDVSKKDATSKVTFTPVPGTAYQIAVDGYNKATGSITLHWSQNATANDMFANAQAISGSGGLVSGANTYATKEPGEPNHAGNAGGASIWYAWTAPATGTATVGTAGSSFDTLLGIYTGNSVGSLTTIASNDNAGGGVTTSQASFPATAGMTYEIAVDGFNGAKGSVTLTWSLPSSSGDPVVVAAGDQHACDGVGDAQTAVLLGALAPQVVLPLGDESGEYGYLSEFTGCYDPTWGAFKSVSRPVPGNHDYEGDSTAAGYFTLLGRRGRLARAGLVQLRHRGVARGRAELELRPRRRLRHGVARGAVAEAGPGVPPRRVHARLLPPPALFVDPGARLQRPGARHLQRAVPGRRRRGRERAHEVVRALCPPGRERWSRLPVRRSRVRRRDRRGDARPDQQPCGEQRGVAGLDAGRAQADAPRGDVRLAVRPGGRRNLHRLRNRELSRGRAECAGVAAAGSGHADAAPRSRQWRPAGLRRRAPGLAGSHATLTSCGPAASRS